MADTTAQTKGSAEESPSLSNVYGLPEKFAEAWINVPRTVCAKRLPAYSLHAHMMLAVLENPLGMETLPDGYKITWEDLWEAVTAVSTPYGAPVSVPSAIRCIISQRWHRMDLATELAKFRAWQNDYLSAPDVFCSDGEGRPLTAPGILARVVFLMRHLHMSDERAWTMPIGQALWMHAATLEQINENVSLLEDNEAKLFALLKSIQDGTADESLFPDDPSNLDKGDNLGRAATALGITRTP
jgi:hypothetical protein